MFILCFKMTLHINCQFELFLCVKIHSDLESVCHFYLITDLKYAKKGKK